MAELSNGDIKLLNDVETFGWHVIKIAEDKTGPGFGYSVGFFKTFGHPEVIIIGLNLDLIHSIINSIGENIRSGNKYHPRHFYSGLIEGYDCYFMNVDAKYYRNFVGYARWLYRGDDFPLFQCIYPTKKHIYPWQNEWPIEIANLQPILTEDGADFPIL